MDLLPRTAPLAWSRLVTFGSSKISELSRNVKEPQESAILSPFPRGDALS